MRLVSYYFLFCFIICISTSAYAGKPFEDFSGASLDPEKWHGRSWDGEALTMGREQTGGVFESWAAGSIDNTPNAMVLNQMPLINPNSINTISTDVTILMASIADTIDISGAGIEGFFYDEAGGSVWAGIQIGLTSIGYSVVYGINTPGGFINGPPFTTLTITENTTYNLKIEYDTNIGFTFTIDDNVNPPEMHSVSGVQARSGVSTTEFKALTTGMWGQSTGEGLIVAQFDNLETNMFTDDFSTGAPDPTKWLGFEVGRYIEDNQAEMVLGNTGNSDRTQVDLYMNESHATTNYLQADVNIEAVSSYGPDTSGLLRLISDVSYNTTQTGPPYNGEDGEIYAYITINQYADGSFKPEAYLFECVGATCNSTQTIMAVQVFSSCNVQTDTQFTISIERKEKDIIFKCGGDMITHTLTGTVYPSTAYKWREIRLRIMSPTGNPGVMKAQIDNVYIENAFSWNIFLPTILQRAQK